MGSMQELMAQVRHRVSVEDYHRMAAAGIFGEDDRVELIEGEVVDMPPIRSRHGGVVKRLIQAFSVVGQRAIVSVQDPLRLGLGSEPQPDLMLLEPRADFYADAHPEAGDVLLLVEVGDTSARFDREVKLPLYARHGIREVWLIDLDTRQVEVCRRPLPEQANYADRTILAAGTISPAALPDCSIEIGQLFPWTS